ncbi:hypothetical protein BDA99DRAFT_492968 [Phascolomyces articulosus]|uniref:Uncharacterized protein n=1 Tax=Phascolomyces articulosus TaxID=60185 RepID=A0AAD5PKQ6_9FUNG|nr:hypothetical protein BDA99DRAFT_492968 [Phascolomyces articulosus]
MRRKNVSFSRYLFLILHLLFTIILFLLTCSKRGLIHMHDMSITILLFFSVLMIDV